MRTPIRATIEQREYLVKRVRDELERNLGVVSNEALQEFEEAVRQFEAVTTD